MAIGTRRCRPALIGPRPTSKAEAPASPKASDGRDLQPPENHPHREAERARLRGMSQDRIALGSLAPVPDVRACRLLRRLAEPPRHQAFPRHYPPDHRRL